MLDISRYPALVLNADFTPLSVLPLETWPAEKAAHAVWKGRVYVVEEYDQLVRSPGFQMKLPAVVALREYRSLERPAPWNRLNLFVRDHGHCAYCRKRLAMDEMTVDHVLPRSRGGRTGFVNCVAACDHCNLLKADRLPAEAGLRILTSAHHPTLGEINRTARKMRLAAIDRLAQRHELWRAYLAA